MDYEVFNKGYEIKFREGAWELSRYGKYIASFNSKETARAGAQVELRRQGRKIQSKIISEMFK